MCGLFDHHNALLQLLVVLCDDAAQHSKPCKRFFSS
jgi:hypothetical protein